MQDPHSLGRTALLLSVLLALGACDSKKTQDSAEKDAEKASSTRVDSKDEYAEKMGEEHKDDKPVSNDASDGDPGEAVDAKTVAYATIDGKAIEGYWASPKGKTPRAGLIVIHEWWGLNDNVRAMTRKLAAQGYQALAIDLYEGESAEKPDGAMALMKKSQKREDELKDNLGQAITFMKDKQNVARLGSIGWCFGGGWSLKAELLAPKKIDATVIYYGHLSTDEEALKKINSPILGIFGAEDKGIPVAQVKTFEATLKKLGKKADIHIYEGADHAFANPSGKRYKKEPAEDAWEKTRIFLMTQLKDEVTAKDGATPAP